ncbi:hypothetical protein [Acanthopleuribacter pedis]|uniref:DUF2845 domain-containing protein n=1 Tax=Acanthopleuribacter pedis TaxID=442870 RepID=A0A8J7QEM9_9BACT|nr:hypothetical protein [Acanthopleuribacter pedis]MBO1318335.1 hypothetical protein [Acanthopleuribacter pedis]
MAKRMTKAEAGLLFWGIVIGLPIYGVFQLAELVGWYVLAAGVIIILCLVAYFTSEARKRKYRDLMEKYGDSDLVDLIMEGSFWLGQTAEQLFDSLGSPVDIDQKILKTKKKEVWKYQHQGSNRYGLRVTLDDDIVVGWDQKA